MQSVRTGADAPAFTTDNVALTQFLVFSGHRAEAVHDVSRGRVRFIFEDTANLKGDIADFFTGAEVPAAAYTQAGRVVRRLMQAAKGRSRSEQ